MKLTHVLPLAAATSAFLIPSNEVFDQIALENPRNDLPSKFEAAFDDLAESSANAWDRVVKSSKHAAQGFWEWADDTRESFDGMVEEYQEWAENTKDSISNKFEDWADDTQNSVHKKLDAYEQWADETKKSMTKKVEEYQDWMADQQMDLFGGGPHGGHGGHGKHPHKPHKPHKPELTVYQLISESKYTTKLAKLINKFDDLVEALNSTSASYTVFAPIDEAFEHIPDHVKIPDEKLKKILAYHVIPDFYPAKRVLSSYTAPTLLKVDHLSDKKEPQRLAFKLGFRGLAVNFYSRVVAINIFGTNGVIHGVKSIIVPPPNAITILDLLPGEFSTLELGLVKTGLLDKLNTTDHNGGTLFAPSNFAFQKLGTRVNGFLFSKYGEKYLRALLKYHVVHDTTLYTDALYQAGKKEDSIDTSGKFHIDLPTLLDDKKLSVDIASWGSWTSIHINGFSRVTVGDGVASDGVIHGVSDVLIPPKQLPSGIEQKWEGEELSVEDLMERLEPMVVKGDL